jgi:hypothetical protein
LREPSVEDRIAALETRALRRDLSTKAQQASARVHAMAAESTERSLFRNYSKDARDKMAKENMAMKDGCLAPETLVETLDGPREIADLVGEQTLLTDEGWVTAEVRSFGVQELREVVFEKDGIRKTIYATGKHRWYMVDGSVCATDNLIPGDEVPHVEDVSVLVPKHGGQRRHGPSKAGVSAMHDDTTQAAVGGTDTMLDETRRVKSSEYVHGLLSQRWERAGSPLSRMQQKDALGGHRGTGSDRRASVWSVVSIRLTERVEEVFCAVVPQLHRFVLADGLLTGNSYPIANKQDLKNAIRAVGRAKEADRAKVRKHIARRAQALDAMDLIPNTWSSEVLEMQAEAQVLRVRALTASLTFRRKFDENQHLRDTKGRFRRKLAKLHAEVVETPGSEAAAEALVEAERAVEEGRMDDAEDHASDAQEIVDRYDAGFLGRDKALKQVYGEQGSAMAEVLGALGLNPGEDLLDKYRFTDLPDPVKNLINGMLAKLSAQLPEGASPSDYVADLLAYMQGSDLATVTEIQSWVSELTAHLMATSESDQDLSEE